MIDKEFTKVCRWVIPIDGKPTIKTCSFIYAEWAYFEGILLPRKINFLGMVESFDVAYDRMNRYYKIPSLDRFKALEIYYNPLTARPGEK